MYLFPYGRIHIGSSTVVIIEVGPRTFEAPCLRFFGYVPHVIIESMCTLDM